MGLRIKVKLIVIIKGYDAVYTANRDVTAIRTERYFGNFQLVRFCDDELHIDNIIGICAVSIDSIKYY